MPEPDTTQSEKFYNKRLGNVIQFRNGSKTGLVGLEIECEGENLIRNNLFNYWSPKEDGSLRHTNDHKPCEYVLTVPLSFSEVQKALQYLDGKLKEAGSKIHFSQRTSVHVHINCQDLTVRQLYCYLSLYIIFEQILVEFSGPERIGNLFCLRARDSEYYVYLLENALKIGSLKEWNEDVRYTACNISSIPKFGSLEFRSLKGTIDIKTIEDWIKMLLLLKEQASCYNDPVEIFNDFLKIGPIPFFQKIWNDCTLKELLAKSDNIAGKLWDGARIVRDIAYVCEWLPPIPSVKLKTPKFVKGQVINVPHWGPLYVKTIFLNEPDTFYVAYLDGNGLISSSSNLPVPAGYTLFYTDDIHLPGGAWICLDVIDGNWT